MTDIERARLDGLREGLERVVGRVGRLWEVEGDRQRPWSREYLADVLREVAETAARHLEADDELIDEAHPLPQEGG